MWRAVRKHLNKIMAIMLVAGTAAATYVLVRDLEYTAHAVIQLSLTTKDARNPEEGSRPDSREPNTADMEGEVRLISSSHIVQDVIDELELTFDKSEWDFKTLVSSWVGVTPARSEAAAAKAISTTKTLKTFRKNLSIERDPLAHVITIGFTSKDPEKSALVANALADAYLKDRIETKQGALNETTDTLRRSINELESLTNSTGGNGEAPKQFYEIMLERYQEAREREQTVSDPARIIDRASVPDTPSNINGLFLLGFTLAGSCAAGVGFAFLKEASRSGYANAEEVERDLGHEVLGLIPLVQPLKGHKESAERWRVFEAYGLTEAVRTLVYALLPKTDMHQAQPCKIVAITSSYPDEGKSTVALSLARQAGFSGLRTLLIEGDLRKPGLRAGLTTINPTHGLVDLLRSTIDDVYECVSTEPDSGIDIMLGFGPAEDSFTLLRGERMAHLLEVIRPHYDLVILDCAPIMAVSETRSLVDLADESIFVIRWQATERLAAKTAIRDLERMNAKITGIVVNQVDLREHLKYENSDRLAYQEKYASYIKT